MDEKQVDQPNFIYEEWDNDVFKSGCCMKEHKINTPMIQCTNNLDADTCGIFYCLSYVKKHLNLPENAIDTLCETEEIFKCHQHGFMDINVDDFMYQPVIVEDFGNESKEITVETTRKSRQTQEKEKFNVHFRMTSQNGILSLQIKETDNGNWVFANKSKIHKYKKHVITKVLTNLVGYNKVNQSKKKLEAILGALVGLDEDVMLIVDRILGQKAKENIVSQLNRHRIILLFEVFHCIRDGDLCNITAYTRDVYQQLYDNHSQILDHFIVSFWNGLIDIWTKHPTDKEFIDENENFRDIFPETMQYKELHNVYKNFKDELWFIKYENIEFKIFAEDLTEHIIQVFVKTMRKYLLKIVMDMSTTEIQAKEMDAEQRWYVGQSIGGATANSMKRKAYGGNLGDCKRQILHSMIDSMLLNCDDYKDAKIAFRLGIENNGGLRLLTDKGTEFVCKLLDRIQPKLRQNVVLMYSGKFMGLLTDLLEDQNIQSEFYALLENCGFESDDDTDIDMKQNDKQKEILVQELKVKLFKDFVSGACNRSIWGYLKQIKPNQGNNLTLRNSLKLNLSTATPFSSLQVK